MTNFFESPFKGIPLDQQVTHPNIVVGRHSYYSGYYHGHGFDDCARYVLPDADADRLIIGAFCSIGSGAAFIMAGNQGHRHEWVSTFPFFYANESWQQAQAADGYLPAGDTVIGNDVWIGSEAIIMPGVRVGDGAIIGTRALVTRDVEPYAIVGGNPARVLRKAVRRRPDRAAARDAVVGLARCRDRGDDAADDERRYRGAARRLAAPDAAVTRV